MATLALELKSKKKWLFRYIQAKERVYFLQHQSRSGESNSQRVNTAKQNADKVHDEICDAIDLLENTNEMQVLNYRFIDGLTLEAITLKMSYSIQWISELYRRGLRHINIPERTEKHDY